MVNHVYALWRVPRSMLVAVSMCDSMLERERLGRCSQLHVRCPFVYAGDNAMQNSWKTHPSLPRVPEATE